jgi:hypothetical protein
VACIAVVGRCAGRVAVRDRVGRLGSAPFSLASRTNTVHVPLRRAPRGRATGTVVTLQPGGYVKASLPLRRG